MKQVPLAFVLMPRRRKSDYIAVFRVIKSLRMSHGQVAQPVVELITDFEIAMWKAVQEVFPGEVHQSGCNFHWAQAVIRKVNFYL